MRRNYIFNILLTIGIGLSGITGYQYGIVQKQYGILAVAVVLVVIFTVLKIKLLKHINSILKKP